MLLGVIQSKAQIVFNSRNTVLKDTTKYSNLLAGGKADLSLSTYLVYTGGNYSNDTIRTIMVIADTSKFYSLMIYEEGKKIFYIDSSASYLSAILGYRVAGNVMMQTLPNHHIIERMEYLDRFKRSLPSSLVVLSFTDTKK